MADWAVPKDGRSVAFNTMRLPLPWAFLEDGGILPAEGEPMTEIATLYDALLPAAPDRQVLERKYPAMIGLAQEILGVYANVYSFWTSGRRPFAPTT